VKRIVAILLAFPLAGCFADQRQQAAACKLEALRLYPTDRPDMGHLPDENVVRRQKYLHPDVHGGARL
jgi:hypothetical protein